MSFLPRPCAHCSGTSFHVIPGVQLEAWRAVSLLGVSASSKLTGGKRWTFTLVACTQCGRTETFTNDAASLAAEYSGSQIVTTNRPA